MNLNRKGFMMAEVVIVAAMILIILMSIYTGYSKVYIRYSEILNYYNADGVYKLANIRDKLINNGEIHNYLDSDYKKYNEQSLGNKTNIYFIKKDYLGQNQNISGISDTYKDYLNYLNNSVTLNHNYIMVIEWPYEDNKYYYNYLELEA